MMRAKKRKDNRYKKSYTRNGVTKYFYGATEAEATAKKELYIQQCQKAPNFNDKLLVSDWMDEFLLDVEQRVSRATYVSYRSVINTHINPFIGDIRLTELQAHDIRSLISKLTQNGKSTRTIEYAYVVLNAALSMAVDDGFIPKNPAHRIKRAKVITKEKTVVSAHQLQKLLQSIDDKPFYRLIYITANTGLRREEILALRLKDVNEITQSITVAQTLHYDEREVYITPTTKNKTSNRTIRLDAQTMGMVKQQIKYVENLKMTTFGYQDNHLLFPTSKGLPIFPNNVSKRLKGYAAKANLPASFTFHSLRHTHATLLLQEGVNYKAVQERLGHATAKVTMDSYAHVTPKMEDAVLSAVDKIMGHH